MALHLNPVDPVRYGDPTDHLAVWVYDWLWQGRVLRAAVFGKDAGDDFHAMIQARMIHDFQNRAASTCFGICCGIDKATEAGVEDGPGAHGAGFERDDKRAAGKAVVVQMFRCIAHGDDFGVRCGIIVADDAVVTTTDDAAVKKNDGAYWYFAFCLSGVRFGDGFVHGFQIGHTKYEFTWLQQGLTLRGRRR